MKQQRTHQDDLTSHTLSSKMKKNCTTKNRIKDEHKKDIFRNINTKIKNMVLPGTVSTSTTH